MAEKTIVSEVFEIRLSEQLLLRGKVKTLEGEGARPVVIVGHGYRGFQDWAFWPEVTDQLAESGFYTISFDFSRITAKEAGGDEAVIAKASTVSQELADLDVILQHVKQKLLPHSERADSKRVALIGHSRAGSSSLILAAEQPADVQAVVVWNGGAAPSGAAAEQQATLLQQTVAEDAEANKARFNVLEHFGSLKQPVLLVQGSSDNERLLAVNKQLKEANPEQTFVSIEGADHVFGVRHPYEGTTLYLSEALQATLSFLDKVY
ncbi:dienelactone hydrolase [Paenibacillus endophyticus]|uniref:Dienelactone hydrolase n=1 Tax=Paenibacillus endophyticus TaxID=1294268 RepID=A0A7W5G7Y4_9BACL|nr:dienelactone hydrolase family protein [Paenibacillus endophyticus]MBB3150070.1 dienelactone hydrolase [Paenibacillus endophyticus]